MNYFAYWRELLARNKTAHFLDIILKGYSQVLICLHPATGFLMVVAIFYLSRTIGFLTLVGVLSSTLTAFVIRARAFHINAGVYGFNGVILGIAWLWFFRMNMVSIILLVFTAALSSFLMKLLIDINSRTKTNLPVFSIPSVILIWSIILLLQHKNLVQADQHVLEYLRIYYENFACLSHDFALTTFLETFHKHVIVLFIIILGLRLHSRISLKLFLISFLITIVMIYSLGGAPEFKNVEFYLYNSIPCSIALGGTFLVFNRKVLVLTILGVIAVVGLTFIGIRIFPLPVFVAPFNFTTILFIWLVKAGFLRRKQGFYSVPMELISTSEFSLEWYKGELYADNYWRDIENLNFKK